VGEQPHLSFFEGRERGNASLNDRVTFFLSFYFLFFIYFFTRLSFPSIQEQEMGIFIFFLGLVLSLGRFRLDLFHKGRDKMEVRPLVSGGVSRDGFRVSLSSMWIGW
jgi:hypothetical protein